MHPRAIESVTKARRPIRRPQRVETSESTWSALAISLAQLAQQRLGGTAAPPAAVVVPGS